MFVAFIAVNSLYLFPLDGLLRFAVTLVKAIGNRIQVKVSKSVTTKILFVIILGISVVSCRKPC